MANELLSVHEALALRRRVTAAEAELAVVTADRALAIGGDFDEMISSIAVRYSLNPTDETTRLALMAAFDAGWAARRARGDGNLAQAYATADTAIQGREQAERERDASGRALAKALAEIERLRALVVEQSTP